MQRIALSSEALREVGITFPERIQISVRQAREANVVSAVVARESAARQAISVGVAKHLRRSRRAGEISLTAHIARIAPGSLWIPMPRFDGEFRVLTIRNRLPSRGQRSLQSRGQQIFVDSLCRNAVHTCSQRFSGHKMVGGMRKIDNNCLSWRT